MGQFLPADHSRGDANTVGGYTAVHSRPPAFEARDGQSYSVEIVSDETGEIDRPWAAYFLFVRWRHGDPVAVGHLESGYVAFGKSEEEAVGAAGRIRLNDALAELNQLIRGESVESRPWYEAMRDEGGD